MQRKNENLKDFICALSFQHEHYIEKPVMLSCEHGACNECVNNFKNNTGLKQIKCFKCNKESSIEIDYKQSKLLQNYMNLCSDKILENLNNEFEETVKKSKGKYLNKLKKLQTFGLFKLKDKLNDINEHLEVQVNYWKEEVEIRAESLKNEIDKIKESFIIKLDKIKCHFK
jgi:hypothetical protein